MTTIEEKIDNAVKIDWDDYKSFVHGLMSETSESSEALIKRLRELDAQGINGAALLLCAIGLAGEAGEILDLVKKVIFHDKPFTPEVLEKLVYEHGDVLWYMTNGLRNLNVTVEDAKNLNTEKLMERYPGGVFDPNRANTKKDDKLR